MKKFIALISALLLCFGLTACADSEEEVNNVSARGIALAYHECTLTLESKEPLTDEGEPAVFKSTISASDISLSLAFAGKSVKSVKYVDSETIEVTLTGRATGFNENNTLGQITISSNGVESSYASFDIIELEYASMRVYSSARQNHNGSYSYNTEFILDVGTFDENTGLDNVRLAEGSTGTIQSVSVDDGVLRVDVIGASSSNPVLVIDASVTSFGVPVTISMGVGASAVLE